MHTPKHKPEPPSDSEFERFYEAQPFLQLLADMVNRVLDEKHNHHSDAPVDNDEQNTG